MRRKKRIRIEFEKFFSTRYAYSPEDIEELATLAGFKIKKIEREKRFGDRTRRWKFVLCFGEAGK